MKIKAKFIYLVALTLMFGACSEKEIITIGDTVNPVLESAADGQSFVLAQEDAEEVFATFEWSAASFGFNSALPEYTVQLAIAGSGFEDAVVLATTTDTVFEPTVELMNKKLIALEAVPGTAQDVELRVLGSVHADYEATSNNIAFTATAYESVVVAAKLYLTGDHNGWAFTDDALIYSLNDDGVYNGYVYLDNGSDWNKFKFSKQADWTNPDVIYGDVDESGITGALTPEGASWVAKNIYATEGSTVYYVQADLNALTYALSSCTWALTGDFNGWSTDTDVLSYDTENKVLSITLDMTAGGFKFILNNDWSKTLGDDEADGVLNPGTDGNNIQIAEAGNYTITMDLSQPVYTYSVTKN